MAVTVERLLRTYGGTGPAALPRLNLGCGPDARDGYVNLDVVAVPGAQLVARLGQGCLPFPDASFGLVLCQDILEHVDVVDAMREVHRVTAPGGLVVISAVHFTSRNLYVDPTHVRGYSVRTFDFFVRSAPERTWSRSYYFDFAFDHLVVSEVQFGTTLGKGRFLFWDRFVEPCVNSGTAVQDLYEMTFLSRLFPAANVLAVLRR